VGHRSPTPIRRRFEGFDVVVRSFGCAATRGSTGRAFVRISARSVDDDRVFVGCDAGRVGASRRVAGAAACTDSAGRLADFVDSWPAVTRTAVAAAAGPATLSPPRPSLG